MVNLPVSVLNLTVEVARHDEIQVRYDVTGCGKCGGILYPWGFVSLDFASQRDRLGEISETHKIRFSSGDVRSRN